MKSKIYWKIMLCIGTIGFIASPFIQIFMFKNEADYWIAIAIPVSIVITCSIALLLPSKTNTALNICPHGFGISCPICQKKEEAKEQEKIIKQVKLCSPSEKRALKW